MALSEFTFTDRARPIVEVGIGDNRIPTAAGQWDQARWDTTGDVWSGVEPTWLDITCNCHSYACEYGRARTIDRFMAGTATIVVDNATGWADPHAVEDPGQLTMRPGRAIRMGIIHDTLGTRWLFRGFIDAMNPTYDPVEMDTVEFACIDALGEINRAQLPELATPVGAGDRIDARINRILDAAKWPTPKRDLQATSDTLIAHTLGGQVADLIGQAADSGGGSVFGDLDGNVAFRGRDWQTFAPGTPPDGTIGNVEMGHTIPGVPEVPAYLNPTVGTVTSPQAADDPAGQKRVTADPTTTATAYTLGGGIARIGTGTTTPMHWHQYEAINRARLVFPGVAGNYLRAPDAANLDLTTDVEIVARVALANWTTIPISGLVNKSNDPISSGQAAYQLRVRETRRLEFGYSTTGSTWVFQLSNVLPTLANDQMIWVRARFDADNGAGNRVVTFDYALDSPTEPATWTSLGSFPTAGVVASLFVGTAPLFIGTDHSSRGTKGRIARVIVRNGIAGTAVLDVSENNAGTMATGTTFVASTGQTVTVTQTAGNTIVQPQPDAVVWRFDANDYPGTGTSYVDPRGRTWTLTAAAAIVPKVPAVPPIDVPADVCPTQWERPFARADMTTRVIIGRDTETAQLLDDTTAQLAYGIEPFTRTDLLTESDALITRLGNRILRTRAAATSPRIRSVSLDASTATNALDLMSTVDPYLPSRYRCRLQYPRGDVFDAEHFATAVSHDVTPSAWTVQINLDLAAPWVAAGGRWDQTGWDQATWAETVALVAEARELIGVPS